MNRIDRNIMKRIVIFLCALFVLAGCMSEDISNVCPGGDAQTSIPLSISNTEEVTVRSIATSNERTIEDAYVLVFDAATDKYKAGEKVNISTQLHYNGQQRPILRTNLDIYNGSKVVVLANTGCGFTVIPLTEDVSTIDDINTVFPSDAWNIQQLHPNEGKAMPMSGIMTFGVDTECQMIRSVAKIELIFGENLAANDVTQEFYWRNKNLNFGLCHALSPQKGCIYAAAGASTCVIPQGIVDADFQHAAYVNPANTELQEHSCFYAVEYPYATKARLKDVDDDKFAPERTGVCVNAGNKYFRIDLYDHTTGKYLDIRRNYHYKIVINKVKSQGYDSIEEALENSASNIEYDIVVTGENDNVVVSNGQYGIILDCEDLLIYYPEDKEFVVAKARFVDVAGNGIPSTNRITASPNVTLSGATSLSATEQEIKASMTGDAGTVTIKVGNITKIINIERHPVVDAHYGKQEVSGSFLNAHWTRNDNNVRIEMNGTSSMKLLFQENVTPINIAELGDKSAEPIFEDKFSEGYVSRPTGLMKIITMQMVPEYIGWLGGESKQTTGDSYYSKRLILESVEEKGDRYWSNTVALEGASSYEDGIANCKILMAKENRASFEAAYDCYMKNDANGNGVIDGDETVKWYLPAKKQLMGIMANYALVEHTFAERCYWASTESTNGDKAWYVGFKIFHVQGHGKKYIEYGGRVRCVRDIEY